MNANELKVYEHHINCIYKCGMLLDEHDVVLREFWRIPDINHAEISWVVAGLPLLCGSYFVYKTNSYLPLALTSLPLGLKILKGLTRIFKCRKRIDTFENFTSTLRKVFDLNRTILQYYERRISAINKLENQTKILIEKPLKQKLSNLIILAFIRTEEIVLHIQDQLLNMYGCIPTEFAHIFELKLNDAPWCMKTDEVSRFNIEHMCYVLATSTFLMGIGLALYNDPDYILDDIIPMSKELIESNFYDIQYMFQDITCSLSENEISPIEKPIRTNSTATVCKFIDSVQLTFYAALGIRQSILKGHKDNVRNRLVDLENLFQESVNLLLMLQYEHKSQAVIQSNFIQENDGNNLEEYDSVVRYDDLDQQIDEEEFNLSFHGSDIEIETENDTNLEYEQLKEQIQAHKVIIKELNDELLRRKLVKEEWIETNKIQRKKSQSPINEPLVSQNLNFHNMDFLAQIKAVAQNRGVNESVFGEDSESDE